MNSRLPRKTENCRGTEVANLKRNESRLVNHLGGTNATARDRRPYLELAPGIKEQIFGLDIPVGDSLSVDVAQAGEELLEAAFDLGSAHIAPMNGSVQIPACAKLHDFAPDTVLILQKIDRLDDIGMMEGRRNAKLRRKLLDVLLLGLVLSAFPELLENKGVSGQDWADGVAAP